MHARIDEGALACGAALLVWQRDFCTRPELANNEYSCAAQVAAALTLLSLDSVRCTVAKTGVVGVLVGARPGPVVALRAEMDAEIVTGDQAVANPIVLARALGADVRVAHTLGHDFNTAVLLGAATVLAGLRGQLAGTVKFIFQPAHSLAALDACETAGAELMVQEGVLDAPRVDAIFAIQSDPSIAVGSIEYGIGNVCASSQRLYIQLIGQTAFGAYPWLGKDPIPVAAQLVQALQLIVSRQMDITRAPALISFGRIHGGQLPNRIAATVELEGMVRLLDQSMEADMLARIRRTVEHCAAASELTAVVSIEAQVPALRCDERLARVMVPSLQRPGLVAQLLTMQPCLGSENFAFFTREVPGFYFSVGTLKADLHSAPGQVVARAALVHGVRVLASLAVDYLALPQPILFQ